MNGRNEELDRLAAEHPDVAVALFGGVLVVSTQGRGYGSRERGGDVLPSTHGRDYPTRAEEAGRDWLDLDGYEVGGDT